MKITYAVTIGTLGMMLTLTGCFKSNLDPGALGTGGSASTATDRGVLDPTVTWLGAGNYSDVDLAALPASKVCSDKSIFGTTGTAVCASAPSALDVTAAFVSGNYSSIASAPAAGTYRSSVTLFGTVGTMAEPASHASTNSTAGGTTVTLTPQLGYWDGSRTVSITDAALVSTNIRAGYTILGVSGDSNVVNTSSGDAVAGNILSGKKAYVDGAEVTGTATDQGALNLNTTAIPGSSGGFYTSIALTLSTSSVCTGTSIFGSTGIAVCNSVFGDLTASNMHRDVATAQMTLTTEKASGAYASGYRNVPKILKDDDGYWTADQGCNSSGGAYQTCSTVVKATRPSTDCGMSGAITARIADCVAENGAVATWSGATKGLAGEATWKLVTRKNGSETWRDERTGLLWSDNMPSGSYNWCRASGSSGGGPLAEDDPSDYCDNAGYQDQTTPYSVCAEVAGFQSPDGEDYAAGTSYADAKGGMGLLSATSVRWRLPTKTDYMQADIDGIRFVLPNMNNAFWSASVYSSTRDYAWVFSGYDGVMYYEFRISLNGVRCVGR